MNNDNLVNKVRVLDHRVQTKGATVSDASGKKTRNAQLRQFTIDYEKKKRLPIKWDRERMSNVIGTKLTGLRITKNIYNNYEYFHQDSQIYALKHT